MALPIIGPVLGIIDSLIGGVSNHFKQKAEIKKAKVEGEIQVIKQAAQNTADWEKIMAEATKGSWKDEYWTLILSIPAILVFVPSLAPYVKEGFAVLTTMPEWYQYVLIAAILASFGIRVTDMFKKK
jgi:hypothetical protein